MAKRHRAVVVLVGMLLLAACGSGGSGESDELDGGAETVPPTDVADPPGQSDAADGVTAAGRATPFRYPTAPSAPAAEEGSPEGADQAIDRLMTGLEEGRLDLSSVDDLREAGDARHAWLVSDLLHFFGGFDGDRLVLTFEELTGTDLSADPDFEIRPSLSSANHLIAWDTPDYPGHRVDKSRLFLLIEPAWAPFFADGDAAIDWRYLGWGGVRIDDRPLGDSGPCLDGCIPALDDPVTTGADEGDWYPDDRVVFGLVEGGEALAIPKNIAEVHEMFNLTLGGRRFGIPYCTLCGSAQAYRTDDPTFDSPLVLRTSGLLSRSNKVMYDLASLSVFDTFTGEAVSGPLQDAGVALEEVTVVSSTWAEWRAAHPDTEIIAQDGGIGRSYDLRPLGDRDAGGPIFPIGSVDDRLPVQELVVGVTTADGRTTAFASAAASAALDAGDDVELDGVALVADGDGLRAIDVASGEELTAHEAFWFAWSQFHPDTDLWRP
ncbi:MAG: DUF3179 domain-containing (seleno)protein [Acidimicrobiia bacterium]|nr:DUF3179 domain-containing (seleno)protein [Acidimicrobiia bacterium]